MMKNILIALAVAGVGACCIWHADHKKPMTAAQVKEFEDSENMFPATDKEDRK